MPRLLQHRSAALAQIEDVRADGRLDEAAKRNRLRAWKERWLDIQAQERRMQRRVIEHCLRAATLGTRVSRLIETYDRLSLQAIEDITTRALDEAGRLRGRDLAGLRTRTARAFETIRRDPGLRELAEAALSEGRVLIAEEAPEADAPPADTPPIPEPE